MIDLGVNIDHVATLRQARGTRYPSPVEAALIAESSGADSITLHLREDRRHIQDRDVELMRDLLKTRMNLEMAVTPEMVEFAMRIKPQDVCLVPERRAELTTEGGLDVVRHFEAVRGACEALGARDIRVSLFIDPDPVQVEAAHRAGAPVVELHTGRYAEAEGAASRGDELSRIVRAVKAASDIGIVVNAGHGLNYHNVADIAMVKAIRELNIGHAIVAHALFVGFARAVREMKDAMLRARGA